MLFSSQAFVLVFLPTVVAGYYALAGSGPARQSWLILASFVFYGWWDVRFVPLLFGLTGANWLIALWFGRTQASAIPVAGVVLNLAVLVLFKYADFLRGSAFGLVGGSWHPWSLVLPLGISFFVFQKISYLIDLKRGDRHLYGFLDFFMFVTFFPQLIAGPLVRHNEIIDQFQADPRRQAVWENLGRGFFLFLVGMAKKVGLADSLAPIADPLFLRAVTGVLTAAEAWLGAIAYTLQIYFDFSGYSDMAIGLALMFGLSLPLNFDAPYRSVSARDFWRRWHMTLSRFLRDYLYIPLGGNRHGPVRQTANLVATMLIGGLWHGANWTFVVWGGLHGVGLAVDHVWSRHGVRLPRVFAWALTLLFVMCGWVLFRSPDFGTAGGMLASMGGANGLGRVGLDRQGAIVVAVGAVVATVGPTSQVAVLSRLRPRVSIAALGGLALAWLLLLTGGRLQNAFIYFQF